MSCRSVCSSLSAFWRVGPEIFQYRFHCGDARVLIWDSEDQADWQIAARTEESLTQLGREPWTSGSLVNEFCSFGDDVRGDRVLKVLHGAGPS
jgi:hypothetical protein